jgi:hypothetical protein
MPSKDKSVEEESSYYEVGGVASPGAQNLRFLDL